MSELGTLTTGAGIASTFAGQAQCESYILIGDVDTALPLQGLSIEVGGTTFINIQGSQPLMQAFAEWQMENAGGAVGFMLKVATGQVRENTTYRFVNAGATTPTIYVFSDSQEGVPLLAATKSINDSSFDDFEKFSALFITAPANIDRAEIVFADGHPATLGAEEIDAYFTFKNQADANGRLAAVSVLDNTDQSIRAVRLYATGASLTVLVAKLPNEVFDEIS